MWLLFLIVCFGVKVRYWLDILEIGFCDDDVIVLVILFCNDGVFLINVFVFLDRCVERMLEVFWLIVWM